MKSLDGLHGSASRPPELDSTEHVLLQHPLQRVLEFHGRSIDDVINSIVVRNEIRLYWKYHKQIARHGEISELERQWNAVRL